MKKIIIAILSVVIILVIVGISIISFVEDEEVSAVQDITSKVFIEDNRLDVTYLGGNMIDEEIAFGNKYEKIIEIKNNNDLDLSYALHISEVVVSDEVLTYSVYNSLENESTSYIALGENNNLIGDTNLAYNLVVPKRSVIYVKVEFRGNNEIENTNIKGILEVTSNLSEKDVFKKKLESIQSELNSKIDALNGINVKGLYIIELSGFSESIKSEFSGFILVDATDISYLEYYYTVYNNKYMVKNIKYTIDKFEKKYIQDIDMNYINTISFDSFCSLHTNKDCYDFNMLTYNEQGGKKNFYNSSVKVIDLVKNSFTSRESKVFIYDVQTDITNDTNIKGYILINNIDPNNPEYFIYLANDYFMVSGYNLTKLGIYKSDSSTIRAYNQTAFNLASENMAKVCSFSGFSECFNIRGEKVI